VLYNDPNTGMAALLFRLALGAIVPLHEHTGVENEEGVCTAGNFVWRPAGNTHEARAPHGAPILGVSMSPNQFAAGQKFFTEEKPG
jgi:quercetin dioxygenase-like cupin family protein